MLKSRDDLDPVPEGGGRSREEWRGVLSLSLCSHNVGFNSQDKPGGKTENLLKIFTSFNVVVSVFLSFLREMQSLFEISIDPTSSSP